MMFPLSSRPSRPGGRFLGNSWLDSRKRSGDPGVGLPNHAGHCDVHRWRHAGSKPRWSCCLLELQRYWLAWASMGSSLIPRHNKPMRSASEWLSEHSVPPSLAWSLVRHYSPSARVLLGGVVLSLGLRRVLSSFLFGINRRRSGYDPGRDLFPGPRRRCGYLLPAPAGHQD